MAQRIFTFAVFLCICSAFLAASDAAQASPWSNFTFKKDGEKLCEVGHEKADGVCYESPRSLNLSLVEPLFHLYPQISSLAEWQRVSPKKLPTDNEDLKAIGGAISLAPNYVEPIARQLTRLDVEDISILIPHPIHQIDKLPFACMVSWTSADKRSGTVRVIGYLRLVDGLFQLDLKRTEEFRDRFVANTEIQRLSGDPVPIQVDQSPDQTVSMLKHVVIPMLVGQFVSNARIGFNEMEFKLQLELQNALEDYKSRRSL